MDIGHLTWTTIEDVSMTTRGTISPTRITRATIDTQMIVIITIIAVVTQGMLTMTRSITVGVIIMASDSIQWREA